MSFYETSSYPTILIILSLPEPRSITLHDSMVDQPLFQLRIGPSKPNHVSGIVIVHFHLCDKNIAVFLVVRLDDIMRYVTVMLNINKWGTHYKRNKKG